MKKKIIKLLIICILVISYLIVGNQIHFYLFCPIRKLTGLYCPGCGVTRMLLHILKGNFYQAFRYNPLLFMMLPFFIIYYFDSFYSEYKQKPRKFERLEPKLWYFLLVLFIGYGILRNISIFSFLKPTLV